MRLRRCATVFVEAREDQEFSLADLVAGGPGLCPRRRWLAYALHLEHAIELEPDELLALAALSPTATTTIAGDAGPLDAGLRGLLAKELAFDLDAGESPAGRRDQSVRDLPWWPLAGVAHLHSRWHDVDSGVLAGQPGLSRPEDLVARFGPPPPAVAADSTAAWPLPACSGDSFDTLLLQRSTCRNFDRRQPLPLAQLAQLLQRVFAAAAVQHHGVAGDVLKKSSPSPGGLHPIDACLLVQDVAGLAPGAYRYDPVAHALHPVGAAASEVAVREMLAGQCWFADAPILVALVARFGRNFWKYRNHSKAYRSLLLEAGHLSQTWQLAATSQRLGAFVTAAINEPCIERAFKLDPLAEGVLAVCGAGARATSRRYDEFDPLGMAVSAPS